MSGGLALEPSPKGQAFARCVRTSGRTGILPGMSDPQTSEIRTQRFPAHGSAADRIRDTTFPLAVRGYERHAVDEFVQEVVALLTELEGRQSREAVVQRALDEVGEQTAGILQRAHEAADEIAARSRAQAEGRIQRAEREADIVRRDADKYAEQVVVDTRLLWQERQRLLEDVRQLADEVLATADDALERVKMPEPLRTDDEGQPADQPTAEVELDVLQGGAGQDQPESQPPAPGEIVPPRAADEEVEPQLPGAAARRAAPGGGD
jgi:DivIVA domain-containing protein